MSYSAIQVANTIIQEARKQNIPDLTPMKLQKLMFFAQSWYIKQNKRVLIDDFFSRWEYGPVIPSIYYEFSPYGASVIEEYAKDPYGKEVEVIQDSDDINFIQAILNVYGSLNGWQLSMMTHAPGTAWSMGNKGTVIESIDMLQGKV